MILRLDPAQLTGLLYELEHVIDRHRLAAVADPSPEAREILLYLYPIPLPQEPR